MSKREHYKKLAEKVRDELLSGTIEEHETTQRIELKPLIWLGWVLKNIFGEEIRYEFSKLINHSEETKEKLENVEKCLHIYELKTGEYLGTASTYNDGESAELFFYGHAKEFIRGA